MDKTFSKMNKDSYENVKLDWVTKAQFETLVFIE
jgi:hypothetical protein